MTDQGQYSGPTATAAPPAPPYGAPPGTVGGPQPAPKKRRTGLIIAAVAVVLLVCLPVSCIAVFGGLGLSSGMKTRETVASAEEHYAQMMLAVEEAKKVLDTDGENADADTVKRVSGEAMTHLVTARDEVVAARVIIETLDDSEGRTAYLESLDAVSEALDSLEGVIGFLDGTGDLLKNVEAGADSAKKGADQLSSAIDAGNDRKYSSMRTKARSASKLIAQAVRLFEDGHEIDPTAELDAAADYTRLLKKQADLAAKMADDGAAGRVSAYNSKIKELNALSKRIRDAKEPAIVSDPNWAGSRLDELGAKADEAAGRADELRTKALRAFGMAK